MAKSTACPLPVCGRAGPGFRVGLDPGSAFHRGCGQWLRWLHLCFRECRWGRRGEEAHPGLSSSCLCQASSSLSSVQCTLSTAALPRALGAGRCSCLVLGQTRLQVWLNPASPSVLGADRAGAGGRGPGCWGRSGKYRWRPCPHPPDTPEKALVGRGVQFCC